MKKVNKEPPEKAAKPYNPTDLQKQIDEVIKDVLSAKTKLVKIDGKMPLGICLQLNSAQRHLVKAKEWNDEHFEELKLE